MAVEAWLALMGTRWRSEAGERGVCPVGDGAEGQSALGSERNSSASGQAAAKARRTRLAVSITPRARPTKCAPLLPGTLGSAGCEVAALGGHVAACDDCGLVRIAYNSCAWIIGANFTGANLAGASLDGPVVAIGLTAQAGEIPTFKDANMSDARVLIPFTGGKAQGANFVGADAGAHMKNRSMGLMGSEMSSADLEGADLSNNKLQHADFSFADLKNVNVKGADLESAAMTARTSRAPT